MVIDLSENSISFDPFGYKAEFIDLVIGIMLYDCCWKIITSQLKAKSKNSKDEEDSHLPLVLVEFEIVVFVHQIA